MSLDPLRQAVLGQAHAEAARIRREASAQAAESLEQAERDGAASVEQASADGRAAGELQAARQLAATRRRARGEILRAKRDLHDEFRARSHEAVLELRAAVGYQALLHALSAKARRQLGDDAVLEIDPPDAGGVRAVAAGRSVDYTLAALTERCLGRLAGRLEDLWT
jgi:vacuolar-type H+-ATPase subunit E/Vma4